MKTKSFQKYLENRLDKDEIAEIERQAQREHDMTTKIKKGIYQHYKGFYYDVLDVAQHTETLEELVVYRALYGDYKIWLRPLTMFLEDVEVGGVTRKRFEFIQEKTESVNQIEQWAKIGKIAEENPDLTSEFIKALLIAQQEVKDGKIEEYLFTNKMP